MGEGQQRYNTDITNEYYYKYRRHQDYTLSLFCGSDRDMVYKTFLGFKYGAIAGVGAFFGTYGISPYDKVLFPKLSISQESERCFKFGAPCVISGTVYGLTLSLVANLRQKDDEYNHFFGGLAAGGILGFWYNSVGSGVRNALLFAVAGFVINIAQNSPTERPFSTRQSVLLNSHRWGWFTERPNHEGIADGDKNDSIKYYTP